MKVMIYEPEKEGYLQEIDNTLRACQSIVHGYIETVALTKKLTIVCNEEGALPPTLPKNRLGLRGTFFVCGVDGDEFRGLTKPEIDYLKAKAR